MPSKSKFDKQNLFDNHSLKSGAKKNQYYDNYEDGENEEDEKAPFLINFLINILITFALSLSIYLLAANIFLTVHKSSISFAGYGNYFILSKASLSSSIELQSKQLGDFNEIYYDCSKNILSNEECKLLNSYHSDYLNSLRLFLSSTDSEQHDYNKKRILEQSNSLKVNTSFFIH